MKIKLTRTYIQDLREYMSKEKDPVNSVVHTLALFENVAQKLGIPYPFKEPDERKLDRYRILAGRGQTQDKFYLKCRDKRDAAWVSFKAWIHETFGKVFDKEIKQISLRLYVREKWQIQERFMEKDWERRMAERRARWEIEAKEWEKEHEQKIKKQVEYWMQYYKARPNHPIWKKYPYEE